jgi:tellurite resistance protein TehA-like permease
VIPLGKMLLLFGLLMVLLGLVLLVAGHFSGKVPWLGRLPGDIYIQREPIERGGWTFYFPLATCLIISVVLTLLFSLFSRR